MTKPLYDVSPSPDEVFYSINIASPRFIVEPAGMQSSQFSRFRAQQKKNLQGSGPFRSLHHAVSLGDSKFGKGLFASKAIEENVQIWRHVPGDWEIRPLHFSFEDLQRLSEEERSFALHFGYQVGDNVWEAPDKSDVSKDASNFMNHSCSPNV